MTISYKNWILTEFEFDVAGCSAFIQQLILKKTAISLTEDIERIPMLPVDFPIVNDGGCFGLDELHFSFRSFDKAFSKWPMNTNVVIDFSNVTFWDMSALLWSMIAIDYYKKEGAKRGLKFKIRLPQPSVTDLVFEDSKKLEALSKKDKALLRSSEYIKRWKINSALCNLSDDPKDPLQILVDEQKEYFLSSTPVYFYKSKKIAPGTNGLAQELLSLNLVEIRNLVDFNSTKRKISSDLVDDCIDFFINKAVCPVIVNQCNIDSETANKFVTHLLSEGLENALQHPNASIGMFAISRLENKLILTISDNGEPIPATIYNHFKINGKYSKEISLPKVYDADRITPQVISLIITHATLAGVSRKELDQIEKMETSQVLRNIRKTPKIGEGLTHIRNATTEDYDGKLTIASSGVNVTYITGSSKGIYGSTTINRGFVWPGNLIRIELHLKEKERRFAA